MKNESRQKKSFSFEFFSLWNIVQVLRAHLQGVRQRKANLKEREAVDTKKLSTRF